VKDPALEDYVAGIEKHFAARRGAVHVLSPRDFALAKSWYQAGLPLGAVLVGIDRAFEKEANVSSLSFCRSFVEAAATRATPTLVSASRANDDAADPPLGDPAALVHALRAALERLASEPAFESALRQLREVDDLLSVATRPNWPYVEDKLRQVDAAVSAAAVARLSDAERAALLAEARSGLERQRRRVDAAALAEAERRQLVRRARERLGLPAVALLPVRRRENGTEQP
jgi:hypothetical protein